MSDDDEKNNAIVALEDGDHVLGVWFVAFEAPPMFKDALGSDIMATLYRKAPPDGRLLAISRVRFDAGTDDMTDDRKQAFDTDLSHMTGREATDYVAEKLRAIVAAFPAPIAYPLEYLRIAGGVDKMIKVMSTRPWCHISRGKAGN